MIATLGLTVGPTTALLSIGNWILWRPTPGVVEPDRLAIVFVAEWSDRGFSPRGVSYLNLDDLRRTSRTLTAIAGVQEGSGSVAARDLSPVILETGWVTADFFDALGVRVAAGRSFQREDDRPPAGAQVAVISDALARRSFGGPAGAVGNRLMLNGQPLTIVGVLPPGFVGIGPFSRVDVWYPGATYGYVNHFTRNDRWTTRADGLFYSFVVRLAPGSSFGAARAELDALVSGLSKNYPIENKELEQVRARLVEGLGTPPLQRESYQRLVTVLLAIGGALLVLGCANVANLLMMRSVSRKREYSVRLALGASPVRLFLLQLTEASLLAAGGAALGIALAVWLKQFVATLLLPTVAARPGFSVPLDIRVLAMALAVSIGCSLAAGVVPAVYGAMNKAAGVADGGRSITSMRRVRAGFAVAQLALSLALVTGALMLVATLRNLNAIDLGFNPAGVTAHVTDASSHGYPPDRAAMYYRTLLEKLQETPGFASVSISALAPFGSGRVMRLQNAAAGESKPIEVYANAVSRTYFDVLGMRITHGRTFTDAEALKAGDASAVAIVSDKLARRLFGETDPIGQRIVMPARGASRPAHALTVIGVVPDVHWQDVTGDPKLFLYLPFSSPDFGLRYCTLLVKSPLTLPEVARRVEAAAKDVDPTLPLQFSRTLRANIDLQLRDRRVFAWVLSILGWLAVTLAAVGLYGLLAQSVAERTREFGIRMAVGSGRGHIFALVIRQAMWIGAFGTALGIGLAYLGSRLVEAQLYGVTRLDPAVYVAAAASLVLVLMLAGLWPARTATRIEPVEALRVD